MTHLFLSDAEILKIKEYVPQAVGFYEHMGFETHKRTELDGGGKSVSVVIYETVMESGTGEMFR